MIGRMVSNQVATSDDFTTDLGLLPSSISKLCHSTGCKKKHRLDPKFVQDLEELRRSTPIRTIVKCEQDQTVRRRPCDREAVTKTFPKVFYRTRFRTYPI